MNWKPKRKVNAGIVAGAIQAAFVWLWNGRGMQPPVTAEIASAWMPVVSYIFAWFVPEVVEDDQDKS